MKENYTHSKGSHHSRNKKKKQVLDSTKLFFIFAGTVLIIFGVFIGDITILGEEIPFPLPIFLGLFLQSLSILIFVNQKEIRFK